MEIIRWYETKDAERWLRRIGESDWRAGQFLGQLLQEDRFRELYGEKADVLMLTEGDHLVSYCTYAEKDEIRDTELTPWMGFVYTFPEYRGRRLLGKLISRVRELAREDGFDRLYISTGESGLYEKYGAVFQTILKNGSGTDCRIYRMDTYGFTGWEDADVPARIPDYPGIRNPKDLYNALWHIWSAETCAPRMRAGWNEDNRTLGQCSVTAFLAQDLFGGKVYGIPLEDGGFHCYNVVDGRVFDLTAAQFGNRVLAYRNNPEQLRSVHFSKEEKRLRYEALKQALRVYTAGKCG